ncbi:MAG: hypothetical protein QOH78_175, partial [Verrucomicrobiota bacterium]
MVEAVFFAVAGNPEFQLAAISFRPFADHTAVKSFFWGSFALKLALSDVHRRPVLEFCVCRRPEENKIVQERNQDGRLGAQGTPQQFEKQQGQADKR